MSGRTASRSSCHASVGSLATTRTESRLTSVENQLRFNFRRLDLCAEGNSSTLYDFPEGIANMLWRAVVVQLAARRRLARFECRDLSIIIEKHSL